MPSAEIQKVREILSSLDFGEPADVLRLMWRIRTSGWLPEGATTADYLTPEDQARLEALSRMFMRFGFTETAADVRARTTYLVQIGYISMQSREDIATRMKRIPDYIAIYTGEMPQPRELDRFFARHGYRPA